MKIFLVCLVTLVTISFAFKGCQPFGPRIFYGASIADSLIYFNTAEPCRGSYLQLVKKTGLLKITCETTSLFLSKNTNYYQTHIHKCRTDQINFEQLFHYTVFGFNGSSSVNPQPYKDYIAVKLADPFNKQRQMNVINLADWSKIQLNSYKYKPVDNLLRQVQSQQQINAIIVNGDIGYDLDTNNATNYQKFLVQCSDTVASLPIIMVTGNHQYNTVDNWQLFVESFELYGLDTQKATGVSLGSFYLAIFDPYALLYGIIVPADDEVAGKLDKILDKAKTTGQYVIPISHYPLACSGSSSFCKKLRKSMKEYWESMLSHGVSLYLGAHWHTYQRLYPYQTADTFTTQKDGYSSDGNYFICILDGVAGNDKDIVESLETITDFTAYYTVDDTGLGVMQIGETKAIYRHLSTKTGETDRMEIKIVPSKKSKKLSIE